MLSGDCAMPDLGLNERDKNILLTQVDVIIHCAATVRFDEHLKLAAMINVRAVRDLIAMAKQMKQLKVGCRNKLVGFNVICLCFLGFCACFYSLFTLSKKRDRREVLSSEGGCR